MVGRKMIYGCIAEKLGHSFSKIIHNKLFDYSYELREVAKDELDGFMKAKDFKAINVTIPYKESVIPYLDEISDTARAIGSVNTIVNEDGKLKGYNTDFFGMTLLLQKNDIDLNNKKVLILGSGGTSKTAYAVSKSQKCKCVYKVSRYQQDGCIGYDDAICFHSDADVIINTTPVGMYPKLHNMPICFEKFQNLSAVVDAIYNPLCSALVVEAKKRGIKAVGGLYMLVAQGALAAEKFTGKNVGISEIDRVFKEIFLDKQNIVLCGMPGSGKSTVGKALACDMGRDFYDTDELIVEKIGMPIPEYFAKYGEKEFRVVESSVIDELSSVQKCVIATGGGAILNETNIDHLKENGRVYFIDRDINSIQATSDRPLSSNREDLEKRYNERYHLYVQRSDVQIKASNDVSTNCEMIKKDFFYENTCD